MAFLYGAGAYLRLLGFKGGVFKKESLPGFVLSVGNLTAGGTGKTPATAAIAGWARDRGFSPAVLSRGYRGRYKSEVLEVSDGCSIKVKVDECGDEPLLLAGKLPGVPVVVSRRRYRGGMYAYKRFGSNFFILDDGFQHIRLERDFDLVLIDANTLFGNEGLLPKGPLREPVSGLSRADAIVLTRCASGGRSVSQAAIGERFRESAPVFYSDHFPEKVVFPSIDKVERAPALEGKTVVAFAGIARPREFEDTLKRLGARVVDFRTYRDHYVFRKEEVQELIELRNKKGAEYLLTTEKDWVRIAGFAAPDSAMGYLTIEFHLLSREADLLEIINESAIRKIKKG